MSFVLGENGIINKAQEAREKTEEAKANEEKDFAGLTDSTDKILNDNENDDDDDYDNGMAKYFTYTVNGCKRSNCNRNRQRIYGV